MSIRSRKAKSPKGLVYVMNGNQSVKVTGIVEKERLHAGPAFIKGGLKELLATREITGGHIYAFKGEKLARELWIMALKGLLPEEDSL